MSKKHPTIEKFENFFLILSGSIIMALAFAAFADPVKIIPGGVLGIATIFHHIAGYDPGVVSLIINIPLFLIGILFLGSKFGIKTLAGIFFSSGAMSLFSHIFTKHPIIKEHDIMLASVAAGILIGVGSALIFKAGATSGGIDIIAIIITKYTKISLGKIFIVIDTIIVIAAIIVFKDVTLSLYALITIFVLGKTMDSVLVGRDYKKAVFIISEKTEEIREKLLFEIDRGGTIILAKGMYKCTPKNMIYTILTPRELMILEKYIKEIDPNAFITIFNAHEVKGKGFSPIS